MGLHVVAVPTADEHETWHGALGGQLIPSRL
jgi:hypothetical protein